MRLALGLRPRLLAALLLTSAVTLAVTALALLSPLEHRLRASGEASVLTTAALARNELHEVDVDSRTGTPDPLDLLATLSLLRRQAGAQAWVLDSRLEPVSRGAPADLDVPTYYPQLERALAHPHARVRSLHGTLFVVAETVHIGGRPYVLVVMKRLNYVASSVGVVESAFIEAAAVGLGIALLLGIALATTMLRRLRRLRDAARGLERGGLDAPLDVKAGRDEIGELARTLQRMHTRLAHQEAALRGFVATASHELRTPLASLDGLLELIEDDLDAERLDLDDARARTARAREQARRLANLASDLLDLSRLDAEVSLRSEPVELSEMARAVVAELELRAAAKEIALRVLEPGTAAWVSADPGALARIVRILLDNALRFSPAGGAIEVEITAAGTPPGPGPEPEPERGPRPLATLVVRDQGPGVPEAERERVFERFRRGSQTAGHGGFGLGLAIGRELAMRMGGTLELLPSARAPGATGVPGAPGAPGASFALRLPAAAVDGGLALSAADAGESRPAEAQGRA